MADGVVCELNSPAEAVRPLSGEFKGVHMAVQLTFDAAVQLC